MNRIAIALLVTLAASCGKHPEALPGTVIQSVSPGANMDNTYGIVALSFAQALSEGHTSKAYEQLSASLKSKLSVSELARRYKEMVSPYGTPPSQVDLTVTMDQWPDKQPQDVGWAYVSISGNDWVEAVTVVVALENGAHAIRSIEWGRP